jgi:hypothetical protein
VVIFLYVYVHSGGEVKVGRVLAAVCALTAVPVAVIIAVSGSDVEFGGALLAILRRVFYEPALVLYWYFELFPGDVGYLGGRSIGKLSWLLGWEYFDTANYVGLYGLGSRIGSVNANAAFIGDLNADFGFVGVVVGGIIAGILMQVVQVWLFRSSKDIIHVAIYAFLMFAFWLLHSTSLPVVLASNGVVLAVLLPRVFYAFRSMLRLGVRQC